MKDEEKIKNLPVDDKIHPQEDELDAAPEIQKVIDNSS